MVNHKDSNKITKNRTSYRNNSSTADDQSRLTSFFNTFKGAVKNTVKNLFPLKNLEHDNDEEIEKDEINLNTLNLSIPQNDGNSKIYDVVTRFLNEKGSEKLSVIECDLIKTLLDHSSNISDSKEAEFNANFADTQENNIEKMETIPLGPKLSNKLLNTLDYKPNYEQNYNNDNNIDDIGNLDILTLKNGKRIFNFANLNNNNEKLNLSSLKPKANDKKSYTTSTANLLVDILKNNQKDTITETSKPETSKTKMDLDKLLNPYTKTSLTDSQSIEKNNIIFAKNSDNTFEENKNKKVTNHGDDEILILSDDMIQEDKSNDEIADIIEADDDDDEVSGDDLLLEDHNSVNSENELYNNNDSESEVDEDLIAEDENNEELVELDDVIDVDENEEENELLKEEEEFILNDIKSKTEIKTLKENNNSEYQFPEPAHIDRKNKVNEEKVDEYLKIYTF
ncbi:hypothetical protein HANVADRAFT_4036 [Hanseniaspora valbyensis NRRL Y-1626]|uniref:Uncharacterized protein n=1 Tax=Hanseniaspora valbyensis NRRL Y-1626 TaxID=766949 RepID=A0A1B7T8W8_9ASCO|nr:hypothetical protein HANVADRAFT_4036 [Hanseniaspora valbyensis NRRL Y-1626]